MVLGKIWSVTIKYHFRTPPYYTPVLHSLASLEGRFISCFISYSKGMAVAADPNFKTFEAAYPYVVQKLLADNSAATRRILYLDGASLMRAMVSKEAILFRQQLCRVIADIIYQWMVKASGQDTIITQYSSRVSLASWPENRELFSDCQRILRDRRLKVISLKILASARKDTVLMFRFCWGFLCDVGCSFNFGFPSDVDLLV